MKELISILILLISFETLRAQVTQEWVARYNGPGNNTDEARSIAVDGSGNVYVTGYDRDTGPDYATVKYNSTGVQQWAAIYNGPENSSDYAYSVAVDASGNVYVTGKSYSIAEQDNYVTIKYNSAGAEQWVATYNGQGNEEDAALSLAVDNSGNVYVTGNSWGGITQIDYVTIKYNSAGVQQWVSRYNGTGNGADRANSIAIDNSGNVYVTGNSYGGATDVDFATIKYDPVGVQQWAARYNGPGNIGDAASSIKVDGSGNVYVTGLSDRNSSGTSGDYGTIKYNSDGVQQWASIYNGPGNLYDVAISIALDISGNTYVTGYSRGSGTGDDYATIKYNSAGIQQWDARYSGPGISSDGAYSIAADASGNVYVTGGSRESGNLADYVTIKYNSAGVQQWLIRYDGSGADAAYSLALDISGNVYVTGPSFGSGSSLDYATVKYSQSIGINQISSEVPDQFSLSQNYPNPFNPKTIINYQLTMFNYVSLRVYDVLGNEVAALVNEKQSPGTYQVEFDGSNLTSGVYFYRIETESFSETKKMLLLK